MQTETELRDQIATAVESVKATTPLVGSITNVITIDFVANAQLAAGGSAAMVYLGEEGEALARVGGAFYINMGSLLPVHEEGVVQTARAAHEANTPWVLDPVGIGIGQLRTELLVAIKPFKPSVIRCNASEAIALARTWGLDADGAAGAVKGVDSTESVDEARAAAVRPRGRKLAAKPSRTTRPASPGHLHAAVRCDALRAPDAVIKAADQALYKAKDGGAPSKSWPFFAVSPAKVLALPFVYYDVCRLDEYASFRVIYS